MEFKKIKCDTVQDERKWLYVNFEKAYKILIQIFSEQEEVEIETIIKNKEDKTNEKVQKI